MSTSNPIQEDLIRYLCGLSQITPNVVKFSARKYAEKKGLTRRQISWAMTRLSTYVVSVPNKPEYNIEGLLNHKRELLDTKIDYSIWNRVIAAYELPNKTAFVEFIESVRRKQLRSDMSNLHRPAPQTGEWASTPILATYDESMGDSTPSSSTIDRWLARLVNSGLLARGAERYHATTGKKLPSKHFAINLVKAYEAARHGNITHVAKTEPLSYFGEASQPSITAAQQQETP